MNRKDFLTAVGLSSAGIILTCIGCSKANGTNGSVTTPPTGVDFNIDLTAAPNAPLLQKGGYISTQGIIVAHTLNDTYIAVQQSCTHENYPLNYQGSSHVFYCNNHGATFDENGKVWGTNNPVTHHL